MAPASLNPTEIARPAHPLEPVMAEDCPIQAEAPRADRGDCHRPGRQNGLPTFFDDKQTVGEYKAEQHNGSQSAGRLFGALLRTEVDRGNSGDTLLNPVAVIVYSSIMIGIRQELPRSDASL
jgi:hypothetical protein